MKKLNGHLVVLAFITALAGCDNDEPLPKVTDPQKAILGRWEVTENSFGSIHYPGSFEEYRADSVLYGRNSDGETFFFKYWFADSLLYRSHVYLDEATGDTILVDIQPYRYEFLSYNKLRLDWQVPALNTKFIFKRLK